MVSRMRLYLIAYAALPIGTMCRQSALLLKAMKTLSRSMRCACRHNYILIMKAHLEYDAGFRAAVFRDLGGERAAQAWEQRFLKQQALMITEPKIMPAAPSMGSNNGARERKIETKNHGLFRWAIVQSALTASPKSHNYPENREMRCLNLINSIELYPHELRPKTAKADTPIPAIKDSIITPKPNDPDGAKKSTFQKSAPNTPKALFPD